MKVAVIDYVGNLGSVMRSLEELRVTNAYKESNDMSSADSFILPGVGNFDCANILKKMAGKNQLIIRSFLKKNLF